VSGATVTVVALLGDELPNYWQPSEIYSVTTDGFVVDDDGIAWPVDQAGGHPGYRFRFERAQTEVEPVQTEASQLAA
jgi:hypothetical protein